MNIVQEFYKQLKDRNIVVVNKPIRIVPGEKIIAKYLSNSLEQLNFSHIKDAHDFNLGIGPTIAADGSYTSDSLEKCLAEAANMIYSKLGNKIIFAELMLPPTTDIAQNIIDRDGIIIRYFEDYLPWKDDMVCRWDILVGKAD